MTSDPLTEVSTERIAIATQNAIRGLEAARSDITAIPDIDKEIGVMQALDPTSLTAQALLTILRQWFIGLDQERASTPVLLNKMASILDASAKWHKTTALKVADIQVKKRCLEFDRIKGNYMSTKPTFQHSPGSLEVNTCRSGCCRNNS